MKSIEKEDIRLVCNLDYNWSKLRNKTILISGGTGFIGSFLIDVLRYRNKEFGDNIKIVSLSRGGGKSDSTASYLKADINEEIDFDLPVDYILHLASNTHPEQYANDPVGTITTNVFGCYNLLKLAYKLHVKRFLLASSVEVYGQGPQMPMDEKYFGKIDCNNARNGYNEAKRLSEALCQSYYKQYGVESVIIRLSRVFGADKKHDTKAMAQFFSRATSGENIVLKSLGNQRFSYCYVADAVSGILKVLLDGVTGEAYNVSADYDNKTLGDYAEYIAHLAGKEVIYEIENNDSVSKADYALLNTDKIKKLGWHPLFTVAQGLSRTFEIKRNNQ